MDCGFLSSIVAEPLRFYPLWDDPLCAVLPENHPLAGSSRRIGLAFSKTTNSVVSRVLLEYLQREFSNLPSPVSAAAAAGQGPGQPGEVGQPGGKVGHGGSRRGAVGAQAGKGSLPG